MKNKVNIHSILKVLSLILLVIAVAMSAVSVFKYFSAAKNANEQSEHVKAEDKLLYRCPMHPQITADHPDKCPICGMDLVLVKKNSVEKQTDAVEGHADVILNERERNLAGVQTIEAKTEQISRSIRTVGSVVPDETRIRHVHTKISGWIEKLFINFTGQEVRKGEPILSIYSPELLATQQEYIQALKSKDLGDAGEQLVSAVRRKLELYDVPEAVISEIEQTGIPQKAVTLMSPAKGFVSAKNIFEGQTVDSGLELFSVTDLSRIWIEAVIYESEAVFMKIGKKAVITIPYDNSKKFSGAVSYIYPFISTDTRTLKVRFDFDNGRNQLKPGMFVNIDLSSDSVKGISIPDSAVIDTGTRQIVYVENSNGGFSPREVTVLFRAEGSVIIKEGISEGEKVAVKGNFLLDSESRIQAGH